MASRIRRLVEEELGMPLPRGVKTAFELVGDIAIVESSDSAPPGFLEALARVIMRLHKHVRSVYVKRGGHAGDFRVQSYDLVAGVDDPFTVHVENGYRLRVNIREVYFSPRSGEERLRVARLVGQDERVLVLFSGIAPFPLAIARHSEAREVVGVELNAAAHKLAVENVRLNKVEGRVRLVRMDARDYLQQAREEGEVFDRIIMPLPKAAYYFLADALRVVKPGGMVHFYAFVREHALREDAERIVEQYHGDTPVRMRGVQKAGDVGVRQLRVRIDVERLE